MPKKGYKQTPEHIKNRAATLIGKKLPPFSAERLANMSIAQKIACNRPEVRAKRSATAKIVMNRPEVKIKESKARTGLKFSAEWCANLSASLKIAQNRPEVKAKRSGPNHHNWNGGSSRLPYAWDFTDELKEEVRERDGYKCQLCGTPQEKCKTTLNVHHIDYDKQNSDPMNLVTLCCGCNSKVNKNRGYWMYYFTWRFQVVKIKESDYER